MPALKLRAQLPRPGDPDIIERFCTAIADGHKPRTASTLAGIDESTARRWLSDGEQEQAEHLEHGGKPGSHVAFYLAFKQAEAQAIDDNLRVLNLAKGPQGKSWVPALALLKALAPREYGDRQYSFVEHSGEVSVTFTVEELPPDRRRALAELALKQLAAPEDVVAGEVVGDGG